MWSITTLQRRGLCCEKLRPFYCSPPSPTIQTLVSIFSQFPSSFFYSHNIRTPSFFSRPILSNQTLILLLLYPQNLPLCLSFSLLSLKHLLYIKCLTYNGFWPLDYFSSSLKILNVNSSLMLCYGYYTIYFFLLLFKLLKRVAHISCL